MRDDDDDDHQERLEGVYKVHQRQWNFPKVEFGPRMTSPRLGSHAKEKKTKTPSLCRNVRRALYLGESSEIAQKLPR